MSRVVVAWPQKDLVRAPDQVSADLGERRPALAHLVPETPETVVGQKFDDIARGEELIADGQLTAVARGTGRLAHRLALFLTIEVLVDPSDGLVLAPDVGEGLNIDLLQ